MCCSDVCASFLPSHVAFARNTLHVWKTCSESYVFVRTFSFLYWALGRFVSSLAPPGLGGPIVFRWGVLLLLRGSSCWENVSVSGSRFVVDLTLSNAARFHNPIVFKITLFFLVLGGPFFFFGSVLRGWGDFLFPNYSKWQLQSCIRYFISFRYKHQLYIQHHFHLECFLQ